MIWETSPHGLASWKRINTWPPRVWLTLIAATWKMLGNNHGDMTHIMAILFWGVLYG